MRRFSLLLSLIFLLPTLCALAGCSQKEKPPQGTGYYEGPMKPAGAVSKGKKQGSAN